MLSFDYTGVCITTTYYQTRCLLFFIIIELLFTDSLYFLINSYTYML